MVQAPRTSRRHRIDLAINHALERRWDLAAEANRALLEEDDSDVESANRLGKALTELGDVKRAIEAYEHALRIEPTNAIARKNLARLEEQRKTKRGSKAAKVPAKARGKAAAAPVVPRRIDVAAESLRTSPLIEEHGKSADLVLQRVNADAAAGVSAGDEAVLEPTTSGLTVKSTDGAVLGHIEPRIGLRLKRMMEGGNRYSVIIRRAEGTNVVVHVRETFKHASLVGQASFLPPAADARRRRAAPRAYTKTSVLHYERGDDYDDEDEDEEWSAEGDGGDEAEDFDDGVDLADELGADTSFDDDDSSDDADMDDDDD